MKNKAAYEYVAKRFLKINKNNFVKTEKYTRHGVEVIEETPAYSDEAIFMMIHDDIYIKLIGMRLPVRSSKRMRETFEKRRELLIRARLISLKEANLLKI